jgi:hypothetical protein
MFRPKHRLHPISLHRTFGVLIRFSLSHNKLTYLHLFTTTWVVPLFGITTSLHFRQKFIFSSTITFHIHEHSLLKCVHHNWHFDSRTNSVDGMFNTVAGARYYGRSAQKTLYSGTSVYVLNPFQILGITPNRMYTERIFTIRNKGKMINPFPWKKILLLLAYYIVHWWGSIK